MSRRPPSVLPGLALALALVAATPSAGSPADAPLLKAIPGLRDVPTTVPPPEDAEPAPLGPGPVALDVERAVALALERNPALQAVVEQIDEVAAGIEEARADALPQVAVTGSWSRSRNPAFLNNPDFEEIVEQFPGGDFEPSVQELYSLGAEATQAIFTFGKIQAAVELARLAGGVVDAQIETARLETALLAAEAYYELLAAERAVTVVEAQERARRGALEVVEARFEIGEATLLEQLRARSSLAEIGPELATLRGDVEVARSRLRVVLGLPPETELVPAAIEPIEPPAPRSLDALLELARAERPELVDITLQREALEKQQDVIQAEGKPQIDFNGYYGRQVRLPENLSDPLFADWLVSIGLRWELFDGGRRKGEVAQLESQRQQLGWQLRDLESRIVLEIETALARYRSAVASLGAATIAAETAREASRVAAETYREGVSLQADLLDAQQQEVAAEIRLIASSVDTLLEAARLARAVGELPTEAGWTAE